MPPWRWCARAGWVRRLSLDRPHLRALLISSADIGEVMMRAFILRRAAFLEGGQRGFGHPRRGGFAGYGPPSRLAHAKQLSPLADRRGWPEGKALVERLGVLPADLPISICPNGTLMRRPSDAEAGVGLGIVPDITPGDGIRRYRRRGRASWPGGCCVRSV